MTRTPVIYSRLEKHNKNKYPIFIKNILIEAGYDSAAALKTIEKSSIEKIEKIVSENLSLLKETQYVHDSGQLKTVPFKFKIGHEALILSIPKDLIDYLSKKNIENTRKNPAIENEAASETDFDVLKESSLNKVKQFFVRKKINLKIDIALLSALTRINNQVKCYLKCPSCDIKVACNFDTCWHISNYYKHIELCKHRIADSKKSSTAESVPLIIRAENKTILLEEVSNILK